MSDTPQLVARFATDAQGDPQYVKTDTGLKRYKIVIEVENAPSDLLAATFYLDQRDYLPVQTVEPGADGRVTLETTAYGDYGLTVDLRRQAGTIPVTTTLRRALLSGESQEPGPKIAAAIDEIAAH